ncbi:MAG: CPBP family intramembrane metalloprotease [Taibaiella sp.]|nr:CPBP family intramembrane metalloprotease [Taibaiella sp.]
MTIMEGINYLIDRENYELQFQFSKFFMLLLISFPMLLVQTAYEEVLFRGYMMQWLGRYMPYRIFPLLLTGISFGVMHMMNPEVGAFGWQVMIDYISIGIILGLVTILSDSLELAIGLHFANNLFLSLFVTFDDSVLQTDAVFRIKEMELSGTSQIYSIVLLLIFFFIVRQKYPFKPVSYLWQYDSWKKNVLDEKAQ